MISKRETREKEETNIRTSDESHFDRFSGLSMIRARGELVWEQREEYEKPGPNFFSVMVSSDNVFVRAITKFWWIPVKPTNDLIQSP